MDKVVACPNCGQKNRVRAAAGAVPHCGKCGRALPWLVEAHAADFGDVVERSPLPVFIDFWAPWCGPCRMVEPAVVKLAEDLAGKLKVVKLNTDQEPAIASRFGVQGIPTMVLVDGGRERDRVTGALDAKALRGWVESRLAAAGGRRS